MRIAGKINYPIQQQKPLEENTAAYCFIGEIDLQKTSDGILVVGNGCKTTRPLLSDDEKLRNSVITEVKDAMFDVKKREDNNTEGCRISKDMGGFASAITPPNTGPHHLSYNSYFYINEMLFTLEWGYCTEKIENMYGVGIKYIDDEFGVLTGVDNIKYKEDILEDFESFR